MTTKTDTPSKFRFPILFIAMLAVVAIASLINAGLSGLGPLSVVGGIATAAAGLFVYTRLSRRLERRRSVPELARTEALPGLLRGAAIGTGAFVTTMLFIGLFGGWDHFASGSFRGFLTSVGVMASAAVNEELLFRGVIFRITQNRFGTWIAVTLSAVLFGGSHLLNTGATLWGAFAIAIEAGVTLAICYAATRSLWLPIGFHFAWNLFESGVFGTTVSGATGTAHGLLTTTLSGPALLTGGSFGPEASLIAVLACLAPIAYFLRKIKRHNLIVRRSAAQS
jgi:membrane protease YdiL (CAAX protease family)